MYNDLHLACGLLILLLCSLLILIIPPLPYHLPFPLISPYQVLAAVILSAILALLLFLPFDRILQAVPYFLSCPFVNLYPWPPP